MKIARKVCITMAAMSVTFGLVAVAAPAQASRDTSWGCGGMCISVPDDVRDELTEVVE
jgi:hypothetical protein